MQFHQFRIGTKLILLTIPIIAVASIIASFTAHSRTASNLQEKLVDRAKSLVHQIMADRKYYASVIVPRIGELGGTLAPDYQKIHGGFPLPATFVREVSEDTAKLGNGFVANLISPWPINKNKGMRDQFQREGFEFLETHPKQPFVETDQIEGKPVLRVLMGDFASAQSCVDCHNAHPDSPKNNFELNGLMGGLEIVMPMEHYIEESQWELIVNIAGGTGMCLLVFGILASSTRLIVSRPLWDLEGRMKSFIGISESVREQSDIFSRGDEVNHLTIAFERMQGTITEQQNALREANATLEQRVIERTEELRRTTAEKERIGSELRIASDIQRSILPRTFPPFPDRGDFTIYATTIPATEMGGDFYDFFLIDQDRLGLVMADVSGKGVPAAIFMAVSRSLIKATALKGGSTAECLAHVNHLLCPDNDAAMFVTVVYGILNTRTGALEYSNAGHHLPYVIRRDGSLRTLENTGGMALGVLDEATFSIKETSLDPGDSLFLFTDGVTEAMNGSSELYGESRLEQVLFRHHAQSPDHIIQATIDDVHTYAGDAPQADDITLLALRYVTPRIITV